MTTHSLGVKIKDIKVGDYVDMEAGLLLLKRENSWAQIDGGWSLEVTEEEVEKWLEQDPH